MVVVAVVPYRSHFWLKAQTFRFNPAFGRSAVRSWPWLAGMQQFSWISRKMQVVMLEPVIKPSVRLFLGVLVVARSARWTSETKVQDCENI